MSKTSNYSKAAKARWAAKTLEERQAWINNNAAARRGKKKRTAAQCRAMSLAMKKSWARRKAAATPSTTAATPSTKRGFIYTIKAMLGFQAAI